MSWRRVDYEVVCGDGDAGCLGGESTTGRSFPWNGERRRES